MRVLVCVLLASMIAIGMTGCEQAAPAVPTPQVLADNGAWTWFNDERAVFAGENLYVGFVDTAGYASVAVHPLEGGSARTYRLGTKQEKDDHNNPAFLHLGSARLLATYALHHTEPIWYWRFAEGTAADAIRWSEEERTAPLAARITYSNLVQLAAEGGRVYNFFRGTNFDPAFMTSDDDGRTWSTEQHFITSGGRSTRPYVKYASDGNGRIDLLFTQAHPRDAATNIYHVYYQDGNLHRSDGQHIQALPGNDAPPMPVDAGTLIYSASDKGRAWVWDLEYDASGTPVAVYVTARDSTVGNDLRYHYARWDAERGTWQEREIAHAGTHLYDGENHYAGGIALDPDDTRTVYTSSDVDPATGATTDHYQIYRGHTDDDGKTWVWTALTPDATADNLRPFVPRGGQGRHAVLWFRGRYTSYTDYDTAVVGVIR